jgi:hypothetical protein
MIAVLLKEAMPRRLPEQPEWVGSTHCRLAASGKWNSTSRFPAMNLKSGRPVADPQGTFGFLRGGRSAAQNGASSYVTHKCSSVTAYVCG